VPRLGREQFETNHILKQLSLAGVHIFEYQNGWQEVRLESPIDKLIMSVSNFAAELERAKASQRTRDALQRKAQRGYNSEAEKLRKERERARAYRLRQRAEECR